MNWNESFLTRGKVMLEYGDVADFGLGGCGLFGWLGVWWSKYVRDLIKHETAKFGGHGKCMWVKKVDRCEQWNGMWMTKWVIVKTWIWWNFLNVGSHGGSLTY